MTARGEGDRYVLNGTKTWLTFGNVAEPATVLVSVDPARGSRGLARLIVELDHARLPSRPLGTLGDRLIPFAELRFEDYSVPAENLMGAEGEGLRLTLRGIQASRVSMASHAVGIAQAAIDAAVAYARERRQFGRPLGSFQLIQGALAEMIAETEAARLLAYRAWSVSDRFPVERYFRDARMLTFPDGTSEVHTLLIGRDALGLDAFR